MRKINKILIANRGEIAIKIHRTANEMGISTLAIYSQKDKSSDHALICNEAIQLKGENLAETYLNIKQIIQIAKEEECDAIHPGYGFLAENPEFPKACKEADIIFIGPDSETILLMGNKLQARKLAEQIGIPLINGVTGTVEEILQKKADILFPVLVKAAAGGGGKGMRIVHSESDLKEALHATQREAQNYFGDGTVYIERYIENPRHIEVQILGDSHGNVIHLFERECTIQRRYQKVIEEAPSVSLNAAKRDEITKAALKIAKAINYTNAGTIEFIFDEKGNFYFLEMNTRIQVEHPVTERITGIDIVEQQIKISEGQTLLLQQNEISINGHAIESRIYAENPLKDFQPSPGEINYYNFLPKKHIRLDSAFSKQAIVHSDYDPMISKLIAWGNDREEAIYRLINAITHYHIHGIETNLSFLNQILNHADYISNNISTHFIEANIEVLTTNLKSSNFLLQQALWAAAIISFNKTNKSNSVWNNIGYWRISPNIRFQVEDEIYSIEYKNIKNGICLTSNQNSVEIKDVVLEKNHLSYKVNNLTVKATFSEKISSTLFITIDGIQNVITRPDILDASIKWESKSQDKNTLNKIHSPMPGKVVKIEVEEGQIVKKGQLLIIIEAMKMENNIIAVQDALVKKINVSSGQQVSSELELIELEVNSE